MDNHKSSIQDQNSIFQKAETCLWLPTVFPSAMTDSHFHSSKNGFATVCLCGLLLLPCASFAQPDPQEYEALRQKYNAAKTDSARVMTLTELAWLYRKYDKPKALAYCSRAIEIARKADYDEGIGFSQMAAGNVYNYHSRHDSAIIFYRKSIPYFQKISHGKTKDHRLGQLHYNLAEAYRAVGAHEEAVFSLNESAAYYRKNKDEEKLPSIYIDIANIYESQQQYSESLKYADKALMETRRLKDTATFCFVMNDLNNVYLSLHAQTKNTAYLTKAKANFYLTYRILQNNPKADPNGIVTPTILTNLGDCLLREAKYDSATYFLNESNRMAAKIQYKWVEGYNYMHLGEIATNRKQLAAAESFFAKALSYRKDYGGNFTIDLYQRLVKMLTAKGDFGEALRYQQLYQKDYGEMLDEKKNRAVNEIQTRYDTREKEAQIIDLQKDNHRKRQQLIGTVALAILGVALAAAIFMAYRFRRKIFRQRERLLQEEKSKAVLAKKVEEDATENALLQQRLAEQENQRIQEEAQSQNTIHALQQEQLQREIDFKHRELTANVMQLEKKNELLIELKAHLQRIGKNANGAALQIREVYKAIDHSLDVEEDFDRFMTHFENVHPQFSQRLQNLAGQSLSALDLKYCAYLRMQLSTKEIANLLSIEPKSVRMAQYRLKKKLSLGEDDDLKEFLNRL